mgnify:CR=1 FL=1
MCGDNVCTPDVESCGNCLQDCPCWMPGTTCNADPYPGVCENVCGNGLCGPGENAGNCSQDCSVQCGDSICSAEESCPADCAGCGDGFCDAGLGENDLSCAQDCSPGGVCNPDGVCDAGAGENPQNCPADCGGGSTCDSDGVCEAGEDATSCPSDCSPPFVCGDNVCTPNVESCGNCLQDCPCATGTTCSPNPAPGICVPQCGNGNCDSTETNATCPQDCGGSGSCDNDGVCDPLESSQTCPSDCTAPTCDFSELPPNLQICCGDGVCDSGENPNRCARDCPATCGDGLCSPGQGENSDSCSQDCCFSQVTCQAGCGAVPTFEILPSNGQVGAFEEVTFTAFPEHIAPGSNVNWDFGDGQHCDGVCGLTATHRYERIGTFPVRMEATENVCGASILSFPQYVAVGMPPVRDDAQALNIAVPSCVSPNQSTIAQITVRNVGGTTWSKAFGQHLQMTGGGDEFVPASVLLPQAGQLPPGAQHTFEFPFGTAVSNEGDRTVTFQMANVFGDLFGDAIIHRVSVRADCATPPPPTGDYTCHVSTKMADGRGVPGVRVRLQAHRFTPEVDELVAEDVRATDDNGERDLAIARDGGVVNRVSCFAENVNSIEEPFRDVVDYTDVTPPRHLDLNLTLVNDLAPRVFLPGLKEGDASARLYGSGPYDKVVVIPTPFRINEQDEPWTEESLRAQFKPFLDQAQGRGFDVWLMRTITGQNIHEQAAEFAQLIDLAAKRLGPDGKVIVAGYSLGGVNARLSTAHYQADASWRVQLGVRPELPVKLVAFGDAPLDGAHASYALQEQLWTMRGEPFRSLNLNSCGAQQLLRDTYPTHGVNFSRFWSTGDAIFFPRGNSQGGVCDSFVGPATCACDGGPAMRTVNGSGWVTGIPIVAFSDGHPGPQGCYGGDRDLDGGKPAKDVCADLPDLFPLGAPVQFPYFPAVNSPLLYLGRPAASDVGIAATAEDIQPGSRLSSLKGEVCKLVFCGGVKKLYFSPTFIPFNSALPPGAPFAASWHTPDYNAVHGVGVPSNIGQLFQQMELVNPEVSLSTAQARTVSDAATGYSVMVTFPNVLADGGTTMMVSVDGPPPFPRMANGNPAAYFNLTTTVVASVKRDDPIEVCIPYDPAHFMAPEQIRLFHYEGGSWADITSFHDVDGARICGRTQSFSPFALFEPVNTPPAVWAGTDRVLEATGSNGAEFVASSAGSFDPDREALIFAWALDGDPAGSGRTVPLVIPLGNHDLSLVGRDSRGGESTTSVSIVVRDTTPPSVSLAVLPRRLVAQASDVVGISQVSFELDGQPFGVVLHTGPFEAPWAPETLSDGTHVLQVVATDSAGNRAVSQPVEVRVDNTPPQMVVHATPSTIWPPNKKLVPVVITIGLQDVMDPSPTVILEAATCDDGCIPAADIIGAGIGSDDRGFAVRATRSGSGVGRTYSFTYRASDAAGNVARTTVQVRLPHDQR